MSRHVLCLLLVVLLMFASATAVRAQKATAVNGISNPRIVNLYWDATWDTNHPTMTRALIDGYTRALVASTYFSGLQEYVGGVPATVATFEGGFSAFGCPDRQLGPLTVHGLGRTAPATTSEFELANLVQCQVDAGGPSGGNVIYNVFVPATTKEGLPWFCTPIGYLAYHYHSGHQPFTAIFARPACLPSPGLAGITSNLSHEMVEAITDPNVSRPGSLNNEIADHCGPDLPFLLTGLLSGVSTTLGNADYFSNGAKNGLGACLGGNVFSDTTLPAITGVTIRVRSASLNDMVITVHGAGFGALPATIVTLPATTNIPYFGLTNTTASPNWSAGNGLPRVDPVTLTYRSWTPTTITVDGFGGAFGTAGFVANPGDTLVLTVCNPQSGKCSFSFNAHIPSAPTVTSLTPPGGPARGGTRVTIGGSGFTATADTAVYFGAARANNVTVLNSATITADAPVNAPGQTVPVSVWNSNGLGTARPGYVYCGPAISGLAPATGGVAGGTEVVLSGTCFADVMEVDFSGMAGYNLTVNSDTKITVTSPPVSCVQSPSAGSLFLAGVNALELDPRSIVWDRDTAVWSPDGPQFAYTGHFPVACNPGIPIRSSCFVDPLKCFAVNFREQFPLVSMGSLDGMQYTFKDLDAYDWAKSAIANVASQGIFPGVSATDFAPAQNVTRADFVRAAYRLVRAAPPVHPVAFTDVKPEGPEYAAAQALWRALDVYRDASGVAFHPAQVLDRQSAAAAIVSIAIAARRLRPLSSAEAENVLAQAPDGKSIDRALRIPVATAVAAGFFYMADGRFTPTGALNRAQMAMLLDHLQKLPGK